MLNLSKQERLRDRYRHLRPGYRFALDLYLELMNGLVTPETRLLDAGCGPGGLVRQHVDAARLVVGADRFVSRFDGPAEIPTLVEADMGVLPFASDSLDLVTCSWVLEHLRHPQPVAAEVFRVLKPGGQFLFITPNRNNYIVWMRRLIPNAVSKPIVKTLYGRDEDFINPIFYRANTYRDIDRLLTATGLVCERFAHVGDPTYLAVNEVLFRLSLLAERVIDRFAPDTRVHLVGLYRKPDRPYTGAR